MEAAPPKRVKSKSVSRVSLLLDINSLSVQLMPIDAYQKQPRGLSSPGVVLCVGLRGAGWDSGIMFMDRFGYSVLLSRIYTTVLFT